MKPALFLTALFFAPLAEVPTAEPITLSEDHRDAVNRQRRIFFQYDPAADIQKQGGFGSDLDAVMGYVFDFVDMPDSQLDAICIDVSNEGVAHYRSTILRPIRHPGLVKWREAGIDYRLPHRRICTLPGTMTAPRNPTGLRCASSGCFLRQQHLKDLRRFSAR